MTQEQIFDFNIAIAQYQGTDLTKLKELIEEKIQEDYHRKENFMLHDRIDDYIYLVYYLDNEYHYYYKGKDAYDEYIKNVEAVKIVRKSKDLFPTFETLIEKEMFVS